MIDGYISARYAQFFRVIMPNGELVLCTATTQLQKDGLVVGDRVAVENQRIAKRYNRVSELRRDVASDRRRGNQAGRMMAANVSQALIVVSTKKPPWREGLIDRLLIAAAKANIKAIICLNKIDLDPSVEATLSSIYASAKIEVVALNALAEPPLRLWQCLDDNISILIGSSGSGKTSIANSLVANEMPTGAVAETRKGTGRHTTTTAHLLSMKRGRGLIIDSPGIRTFGLANTNKLEVAQLFPDFKDFVGQCSFRDCLHLNEGDCAIIEAVAQGTIAYRRYKSYCNLSSELDG